MGRILIGVVNAAFLVGCYAFSAMPHVCEDSECQTSAGSEAGACDQTLAPNVPETSVVYVSSNGTTGGTGSKDSPVNSINAALTMLGGGKTSVFVCRGTYQENVQFPNVSNVSLYGGFSCSDWKYTCEKPAVAPLTGYALEIDNISGVEIKDMHFEAQVGVTNGESSIAVFANHAEVTFTRSELVANAAAKGTDGTDGANGAWATMPDNNDASGTTAGVGPTCTCTTGGSTTAGAGGAASANGSSGSPEIIGNASANDGAAGVGGQACSGVGSTGSGTPGADAPAGASGPALTSLGTLSSAGWIPSHGNDGMDGIPGQGGGGGGGHDAAHAGGGGGCGGCGGAHGTGGQSGGSSVALLSVESTLTFNACTLTPGRGGNGGKGGAGGNAGGSVDGAIPFQSGGGGNCPGGDGGQGGAGGAGSGGAGGISAGILYRGAAPTLDADTTFNEGSASLQGKGGKGGTAGTPSGNAGSDGPDGLTGKMVSADD